MDLVSSHCYWRLKHGFLRNQATLDADVETDVVVVGGGISGAMIAYELVKRGVDTILIERFDIASGSTSASTALIQYETDLSLGDLAERLGLDTAERVYRATFEAQSRVRKLALEISHTELREKKNFYLASDVSDVDALVREKELRAKIGLKSEFLDASELKKLFSFQRAGALTSNSLEIDPYLFTHQLIFEAQQKGLRIYDRTALESFERDSESVTIKTLRGSRIKARHLVFAVGYEAARLLPPKLFELHSSFAMVTKPLESFKGWFEKSQLWETARPYLYVRSTADGRAIVGGLDEPFRDPSKRDELIDAKTLVLEKRFREFFPKIEFSTAYSWAGTFGETKDSLPYIGNLPESRNLHFSCGFGGNGTTFASVASEMIADAITGKLHPMKEIFGFERAYARKVSPR
ncbi:MAG: FAD-binding oxidoreductase [Bdellovibrionota bacterium]